jgi:hypothetical protein
MVPVSDISQRLKKLHSVSCHFWNAADQTPPIIAIETLPTHWFGTAFSMELRLPISGRILLRPLGLAIDSNSLNGLLGQ